METAAHNNNQTMGGGFMAETDFLWKQPIWVWSLSTCKGQDLGPFKWWQALG